MCIRDRLFIEKSNCPVRMSSEVTSTYAEHETKLRTSVEHSKKSVQCENSQSALQNDGSGHTGSKLASQVQKPDAAKNLVNNTASKEFSSIWGKNVEAKRLKWMHGCKSWRYIVYVLSFIILHVCNQFVCRYCCHMHF